MIKDNKKNLFIFTLFCYFLVTNIIFYTNEIIEIQPNEDRIINEEETDEYKYFIHITDTHFSSYNMKNFDKFIEYVNNINPSFFIHTGDITDGHTKDGKYISTKEDFEKYFECVKKLKCKSYFVRGNHDTFGQDSSLDSYFKKNLTFYEIIDDYLFIFLDCTLKNKSKAFLNFFGYFTDNEFLKTLPKRKFKQIFICTHYSTNTLFSKLKIKGDYVLCGHLHTTFEKIIYKKHKNKVIELIGKNYKDGRFRICTLNNGLFSFNDFYFDKKPLVVIMNPGDKTFSNVKSKNEYLRILQFFSDELEIYIDSKFYVKFTPVSKFVKIKLPKKFDEILVKGTNKFGENYHKIYVNKERSNFFLQLLPADNMLFVFLTILILFMYFARNKQGIFPRLIMRLFFPNIITKLYTEKYVFIFSWGTSFTETFEGHFVFLFFTIIFEILFTFSFTNKVARVFYLMFYFLHYFYIYKTTGINLRIDDLFLMFYVYKYFKCKKVKKFYK